MIKFGPRSVFFVRDAPRALEFYTNTLGFSLDWTHEEQGRPFVFQVSLFGMQIILNQIEAHTQDRAGHGRVSVGLDDDEYKAFSQHVQSKGIPTRVVHWGAPTAVMTDLDQNEYFFWLPESERAKWEAEGLRAFTANEVGIDRNDYGVTVGLARDSSSHDSEDAFLLQRSSVPDIDEPGIDGVYLEVPIQKYVTYGGIIEATLRRDSLEIRLSDEASSCFGGVSAFRGEFSLDEAAFDELRTALRFVFRDCACYKELA